MSLSLKYYNQSTNYSYQNALKLSFILNLPSLCALFLYNTMCIFFIRIYCGRRPLLVTTDLDILKEVLVKDFNRFTDRFVSFLQSIILRCIVTKHTLKRILSTTFPSLILFDNFLACRLIRRNKISNF